MCGIAILKIARAFYGDRSGLRGFAQSDERAFHYLRRDGTWK